MNAENGGTMLVYQAIAHSLADSGVDLLFGVTGAPNLLIAQEFNAIRPGSYVAAAHEAGALLMAHGYALTSNSVALATVTHGPGLTNAATVLAEAARAHTPLLILVPDTPISEKYHWQNINHRAFVAATGAGFEHVRSGELLPFDMRNAMRRALIERRPIVLNIPADILLEQATYQTFVCDMSKPEMVSPSAHSIERAAELVAASTRRIILAGHGAIDPPTRRELLQLSNRLGAPVATTLKAKGLFGGLPQNLGVFGTLSTPLALDVISKSECILAFGCSLNNRTTLAGELLANKRVIQFDSDPAALGAIAEVDVKIPGAAAESASKLIEILDELELEPSRFRDSVPPMASAYPAAAPAPREEKYVDFCHFLEFIDPVIAKDRNLVIDNGLFMHDAWRYLRVVDPRHYINTVDFGAIGHGLANAIGASFCRPDVPTLLVCGDGGFMLGGITEFNTAVRYRRDLIVVINNNGSYGPEYLHLKNRNVDPSIALFSWPNFAEIAESLGGQGFRVDSTTSYEQVAKVLNERRGPLLIDVLTNPESSELSMKVSMR